MRQRRLVVGLVLAVVAVGLGGCSFHKSSSSAKLDPFAGVGSPYYKGSGPIPFGGGRYQVGKPYQVAGRWFTPREQPGYDKTGVASWYGEAFHRRKTSNGEWFDMATLTAAHATLPLPSYAKVTNLQNGRSVVVRINDRGPFVDTRVIDLSKRAAEVLGYKTQGKTNVRVQYLGTAPLDDKGTHLAMMNRKLQQGASFGTLVAAVNNDAPGNTAVADAQSAEDDAVAQQAAYVPPPTKPSASHSAGFVIQVATFGNLDNAQATSDALANIGPLQVFEVMGEQGLAYRVQMGPFVSAIGAQDALNAVRNEGFATARLAQTRIEQVSSR